MYSATAAHFTTGIRCAIANSVKPEQSRLRAHDVCGHSRLPACRTTCICQYMEYNDKHVRRACALCVLYINVLALSNTRTQCMCSRSFTWWASTRLCINYDAVIRLFFIRSRSNVDVWVSPIIFLLFLLCVNSKHWALWIWFSFSFVMYWNVCSNVCCIYRIYCDDGTRVRQ